MDRAIALDRPSLWTPAWRTVVFALSAMSIWCLLAEFYGLCSMRTFAFAILIPSTLALVTLALYDRRAGDRRLWRAVWIGAVGGLVAAMAYDVFRVPFVLAALNEVGPQWLRLPLFKVFPRFGAMILSQPFTARQPDSEFSLAAHLVGWAYHLSNGVTFGIMYLAMIGDARRRSWLWAVVMAVALELLMLATPYTGFFGITAGAAFIAATVAAHLIFGVALGLSVRAMWRRSDVTSAASRRAAAAPPA